LQSVAFQSKLPWDGMTWSHTRMLGCGVVEVAGGETHRNQETWNSCILSAFEMSLTSRERPRQCNYWHD
jgi:hypothetical protein